MVGLLSVLVLHHHLVVAGVLVGQMSEMSEIFVTSSQNICGKIFIYLFFSIIWIKGIVV